MNLQEFISHLQSYIALKPPDLGDSDYETVLDQLYQAYTETHESDPSVNANMYLSHFPGK